MAIPTKINESTFTALIENSEIIEADSLGPKVYRLANGNFLKIFRRKRLISSALLIPYSSRFYRNAEKLMEHSIPTLTPLNLYILENASLSAVLYKPLDGITLKDIYFQAPESFSEHLQNLSAFIRDLHQKGIYFRSLHLGNIVLTSKGHLGLIDVADMSFQRSPIQKSKAKRNLAHFHRPLKQMGVGDKFPFSELSAAVLRDN